MEVYTAVTSKLNDIRKSEVVFGDVSAELWGYTNKYGTIEIKHYRCLSHSKSLLYLPQEGGQSIANKICTTFNKKRAIKNNRE